MRLLERLLMKRGLIQRLIEASVVAALALCGASGAGIAAVIAQPIVSAHQADRVAIAAGAPTANGGFGRCAVAIPCYLHSLTCVGLSIDRTSQHESSGFALDRDLLRVDPTPVMSMSFNLFNGRSVSALAMAAGILVTGCGGGGATDAASSTAQAAAATSSSTTASADASTVTQAAVSTAMPVNKTPSALNSTRSGAGMNLTSVISYTSEMPTIDLMKKASAWITQCQSGSNCAGFTGGESGYDTLEEAQLNLDANGWVKSLPASSDSTVKYRTVTTKLAEAGVQLAGTYTVLYDGQGTITYGGPVTKVASQSSAGRDVINIASSPNAVFLSITSTTPTNYIRNIRVYMPGGACKSDLTTYVSDASACTAHTGSFVAFENFPAGTVWHPAFLASVKGFRTLRFMDWGQTNTSTVANWADRSPATARTWNSATGVPLEMMFDLASKAGTDAWMNIPTYATDDYVHQFGKLAHANLASGSKLAIEYSNEVWNYGFSQASYALQQGRTLWSSGQPSANDSVVQLNWYALRLAQVCNIVKSEFGADASRVQCVSNTQGAVSSNMDVVMKCTYAQAILGQSCSKFIDAAAIAPYFGYYIGTGNTATMLSNWLTEADGGLTMLFEEITGTNSSTGAAMTAPMAGVAGQSQLQSGGSLAEIYGWMVANKAVAARYGLPMWAYEGGQSLIPTVTGSLAMEANANRDPRMGAAYATMMKDWQSAGGQTFAFFADVGLYGSAGFWGLREDQFSTSAKWSVAVQYRDKVTCWWAGC
jgi:hypothetical protein